MPFKKDPVAHKAIIDAKLTLFGEYDEEAWRELHLNRNAYNVRQINNLRHVRGNQFRDDQGRIWTEQSLFANQFHMPGDEFLDALNPRTDNKVYSRKFLADDNTSGLGGEYEIIIRRDDKRIDALTQENFQETYNFGRTRNGAAHTILDILPHLAASNYAVLVNNQSTQIFDAPPPTTTRRGNQRSLRQQMGDTARRFSSPPTRRY